MFDEKPLRVFNVNIAYSRAFIEVSGSIQAVSGLPRKVAVFQLCWVKCLLGSSGAAATWRHLHLKRESNAKDKYRCAHGIIQRVEGLESEDFIGFG